MSLDKKYAAETADAVIAEQENMEVSSVVEEMKSEVKSELNSLGVSKEGRMHRIVGYTSDPENPDNLVFKDYLLEGQYGPVAPYGE